MDGNRSRICVLEENDIFLQAQIRELKIEFYKILEKINSSPPQINDNADQLRQINEQMFQQNVRLREFVAGCIQAEAVPTQEDFYTVLQEEEQNPVSADPIS